MSRTDTVPRTTGIPAGRRTWCVAAVACLAIVVAGAFSTMPGLLVTPLHDEYHWSRGSIGFATSVIRVVVAALATIAGGALLTTVMTAAWQLTLYWGLLVGLGTGSMAMAFGATVTNRWFTRRKGLVTGVLASGSVFGQMVFLPVLSLVIRRVPSPRVSAGGEGPVPVTGLSVQVEPYKDLPDLPGATGRVTPSLHEDATVVSGGDAFPECARRRGGRHR